MTDSIQKESSNINAEFWTMLGLSELDIYKFHCKIQEGKIDELKEQIEALQRDKRTLQWGKSWLEGEHRLLKAAYDELWEAIPDAEITAKDQAWSS